MNALFVVVLAELTLNKQKYDIFSFFGTFEFLELFTKKRAECFFIFFAYLQTPYHLFFIEDFDILLTNCCSCKRSILSAGQ